MARVDASFDATSAVSMRQLRKSFGPLDIIQGIDLEVGAGEVVAFLGPNGAGKSTTIDMMLGLSEPTSGAVEVFGAPPRTAVAFGLVAAVLQTGGLLKDLTVAETVRYTASSFDHSKPVDEVLERAGITEIADRRVGRCSGGEQQRLRFAMALVSDPELLVLDEPTAGMDVEGRRAFWDSIRLDADQGRTILFATHYLEEADAYADRIVLIRHGLIVADGTASHIKAMASGRTIRATWPDADVALLESLAGVGNVELRGDSVLIRAGDSDRVARHLFTSTPARDVEITAHALEDAFVALTGDGDSSKGGAR